MTLMGGRECRILRATRLILPPFLVPWLGFADSACLGMIDPASLFSFFERR